MKTKEEKRLAHNKANREWKGRNPERARQWCKANPEQSKQWRKKNPGRWILMRARANAKRRRLAFDITIEDILPLPKKCPIFGIKLRLGKRVNDPNAYSLDRINNKKGYIKGNVVVISLKANTLKSNGSLKAFKAIVKLMGEYENRSMEASTKRIRRSS